MAMTAAEPVSFRAVQGEAVAHAGVRGRPHDGDGDADPKVTRMRSAAQPQGTTLNSLPAAAAAAPAAAAPLPAPDATNDFMISGAALYHRRTFAAADRRPRPAAAASSQAPGRLPSP